MASSCQGIAKSPPYSDLDAITLYSFFSLKQNKLVISSHSLLPWMPGRHASFLAFKQEHPCACSGVSPPISPAGSASPSSLTLNVFGALSQLDY